MHVIFFGPAFPAIQQRYLRNIRQFPVHITGLGDQPHHELPLAVRHCLNDYIQIGSLTDESEVVSTIGKIHRHRPIDKIIASYELHILSAARARSAHRIPGLSYQQAQICRDKVKMKAFMKSNGIPCAETVAADNWNTIEEFAQKVGYPLILKPIDGAGSAQTFKVKNEQDLTNLKNHGVYGDTRSIAVEQFIDGHEGTYDTLTINGKVVCDFVTHYYPNLMQAHHDRTINPINIATNRLDSETNYQELKALGRKVSHALQLDAEPTHMEWFFGSGGLKFSEIAVRPPGADLWDLYSMANEIDLYREWAKTALYGRCSDTMKSLSRKYSAGFLSIRPNRDGRISHYLGLDDMQEKYGKWVVDCHFPEPGETTSAIDTGFKANAWVKMRHPDYVTLKQMMEDMAGAIKMLAS